MIGGPWNDFHVIAVALVVSAICHVTLALIVGYAILDGLGAWDPLKRWWRR